MGTGEFKESNEIKIAGRYANSQLGVKCFQMETILLMCVHTTTPKAIGCRSEMPKK